MISNLSICSTKKQTNKEKKTKKYVNTDGWKNKAIINDKDVDEVKKYSQLAQKDQKLLLLGRLKLSLNPLLCLEKLMK